MFSNMEYIIFVENEDSKRKIRYQVDLCEAKAKAFDKIDIIIY